MAETERDPGSMVTRPQPSTDQPVHPRRPEKAKRNDDRKAKKGRKKRSVARKRSTERAAARSSNIRRIGAGGALLALGALIGAAIGSSIARTSRG